jgi:hypothetical protein
MGFRRQPQASSPAQAKPRFTIKGSPRFAEFRNRVKKSKSERDKYLDRLIDSAITILGSRATVGDSISRGRWPKSYQAFHLPCLFRYDLDANHRMTYSILKIGKDPAFVWIIEVMDHEEYNRRFGYR